jgi:uncharacterized membrane protein
VSPRLRFRLRQLAHDLTSGMMLRPALSAGVIALAGLVLIEVEASGSLPRWVGGGWFFRDDAASAQAVLGAIAGSMMAVISIVYSVLLVALSLASVQFSPRILGSFVRDRTSQRTLGVFLGTFVYCLLVMRSTRSDPSWVATWAVAGGCLLGLACLVFLIYFLHHIATGIQVNHLVDRIAADTHGIILEVYGPPPATHTPAVPADTIAVDASGEGYLQLVDHDGLAALASHADVTIHLAVEPGDWVPRGRTLARDERRGAAVTPAVVVACREGFDLGPVRTMQQDVAFGLRQLVDIALKAISPAVNDPSTASACIDRLGALLAELATTRPGPRVIADRAGVARVFLDLPDFDALVDLAFNQLRQYGRGDLAVSIRMLTALAVAARPATGAQRARIIAQAELVREGLSADFLAADRARFDRQYAAFVAVVDGTAAPAAPATPAAPPGPAAPAAPAARDRHGS